MAEGKVSPHGVYKRKYHMRFVFQSLAFVAMIAGYYAYNQFVQSTRQLRHQHQNIHRPMQHPQTSFLSSSSFVERTAAGEAHRKLSELETETSFGLLEDQGRALSDNANSSSDKRCDDLETADPSWMCVFLSIGVLYLFLAIAIVCDDFFVEALEEISSPRHMNIDKDVAGATLMAAGGSAPELFTNLFGTFDESEIGFGTIVGSAVFNVMLVIAMCSIFAKETLDLTWWPLFRDSLYYAVGLILLGLFVGVSSPEEIEIWEACVLFIMYVGYVLIMWKNRDMYKQFTGKELAVPDLSDDTSMGDDENGNIEAAKAKFEELDEEKAGSINEEQLKELLTTACSEVAEFKLDEALADIHQHKENEELTTWEEFSDWYRSSVYFQRAKKAVEEPEPLYAPLLIPDDAGFWGKVWHLVCFPIVAVLTFTIPDVRRPGMEKYCYIAFIFSILWIGFFAYFMVTWTEIIGNTIGVPHVVMGYTILAAGTSVPDLLSSVIVTRQGSGDMAISSSIGSNIFDILVGLPIPWLIYMAFPSKPNKVAVCYHIGLYLCLLVIPKGL